jgi:DNA polymerase I-like protein with 3'-5' exonuclease and polymerase domains
VCSDYANSDSAVTLPLFKKQRELIKKKGLWRIYQERLKLLPPICHMESRGVTISRERTEQLKVQYTASSAKCHRTCVKLSKGGIKTLPKNGASNDLKKVLFEQFKLTSSRKTKKGNVSIDKYVLDEWMATLPQDSVPYQFVNNLKAYRKRQTALGYIKSYEKYWLPLIGTDGKVVPNWWILYSSVNPTGTDTLRFSSSNPNSQQISKQDIVEFGEKSGHSARYMFGPAPGREWWSMDAKNIELRIPAYEAGEKAMINLFEHPNDPPYFGSNHLLFFDILHPDLFAKHGAEVKEVFGDSWYQWTKNGDFAVQYGAVADSGTADRAYHVPGAQARIESHLKHIKKLSQKYIDLANKQGYVETLPDKTVDPKHGYPLFCTRSRWGNVKPTVPLSYHTQGTAMQWTCKGMIRSYDFLKQRNERKKPEFHAYMNLQVHDEIVFDFPKSPVDPREVKRYKEDGFNYLRTNLPDIKQLKKLMEQGGDDIGIPTPVSLKYHPVSWGEGFSISI